MNTKQIALKRANEIADLHFHTFNNLPMATGLLQYLEDAVNEYFGEEKRCKNGN